MMPSEEQLILLREILTSYEQISQHWPEIYTTFFRNWGYFNQIYNTLYSQKPDGKDAREWESIALFSLQNQSMWESLKRFAKPLAVLPCVGNSTINGEPSEPVRISTSVLRKSFEIDPTGICDNKNWKCSKRKTRCIDYPFPDEPADTGLLEPSRAKYTPLGATLTIIYQVRCNLFHGSKIEVFGQDYERNLELVTRSNRFILELLRQYFRSLNKNQAPD